MTKATIIYYTANLEDPEFERKLQKNILDNCGGLPIISISHKPINFGINICIGKQPLSYSNILRQTMIGLKAAQICKREYLERQPEWFDGRIIIRDKRGRRKKSPFNRPLEFFGGDIPYWGKAEDMVKKFI